MRSAAENAAMWDAYGDKGQGVCIVTSTHRLLGEVIEEQSVAHELGRVTYWPNDKPPFRAPASHFSCAATGEWSKK